MVGTDRPGFELQVGILCAGFNVPATNERMEAYWKGLGKMQFGSFERVVEHALCEGGPEKIPTSPQLWRLYRELRQQPAARPALIEQTVYGDEFDRLGQCWLLALLLRPNVHPITGTPSMQIAEGQKVDQHTLRKLIEAKRDIVALYRDSGSVCGTEAAEWLDVAYTEFARILAAAPRETEVAA